MLLKKREKKIKIKFKKLNTWSAKYSFIINLGKRNKLLAIKEKTNKNILEGCQSVVWLDYKIKDGKLIFVGDSNSLFIRGIVTILTRMYTNIFPSKLKIIEKNILDIIKIKKRLSLARNNGIQLIVHKIYKIVREYNLD